MSDEDLRAWKSKLVGKLYVRPGDAAAADSDNVFKAEDLPKGHRVIAEGQPVTLDFRPDRLNVNLDAEGKCTDCGFY